MNVFFLILFCFCLVARWCLKTFPTLQRYFRLDIQHDDEEDFLEEIEMEEDSDSATDRIRHSTDVATQLVISCRNSAAHLEDMKMQTRNFYGAFIIALLVFFYTKDLNSTIGYIAISVLIVMYWLDVSSADIIQRFQITVQRYERTLARLVILKSAHFQTTRLNYFLDDNEELEKTETRLLRKFRNAIAPHFEQFVLYFVPLGIFIFCILNKQCVNPIH
jgi:hypothetical protein